MSKAGIMPCWKKKMFARVVAEVVVLLEERAGRGVVGVAGHDVPGDGPAGIAGAGEELLGEDLEEGLVLDGGDGELALGAVVAEARALAAGDEEGGDLALLEELVAAGGGVGVELLLVGSRAAGVGLDGLDVVGEMDGGLGLDVGPDQLVEVGQVEVGRAGLRAFGVKGGAGCRGTGACPAWPTEASFCRRVLVSISAVHAYPRAGRVGNGGGWGKGVGHRRQVRITGLGHE